MKSTIVRASRSLNESLPNKRSLIIGVLFGLLAALSQVAGLYLGSKDSGSIAGTHEVFVIVGMSIAGPISGILTGVISAMAYPIESLRRFELVQHVVGALLVGSVYRKVVADGRRMRWMMLVWPMLMTAYFFLIPTIVVGISRLLTIHQHLGISSGAQAVILSRFNIGKESVVEALLTGVITAGVWIALPARLRRPQWGRVSSRGGRVSRDSRGIRRGYLGVRLGIWVVLLSIIPMVFVGLLTTESFREVFYGRGAQGQLYLARVMAHHAGVSGENDLGEFVPNVAPPVEFSAYLMDTVGRRESIVHGGAASPSLLAPLSVQTHELCFSVESGWTVEHESGRFIGFASVPGRGKVVVVVSSYAAGGKKLSQFHWLLVRNFGFTILILSLVTGLIIWLVVVRPLNELSRAAMQIGDGDLNVAIDTDRMDDEVRLLGETFQSMVGSVRSAQDGLRRENEQRREAESALRHSEERYRFLSDASLEGIIVLKGETIRDANAALSRMLGRELSDVTGRNITDLVPDYRSVGMSGGHSSSGHRTEEVAAVCGDGRRITFEMFRRNFESSGEPLTIVVCRDMTERRRAEAQLRMLAQAVDQAGECICMLDMSRRIIYVNEAFRSTYGYTSEELVGEIIDVVSSPSNEPGIQETIRTATLDRGWHGEVLNIRKDGTEFPILLTTAAVRDEKGRPLASVSVARDITEQKQHEIVIQRMNEELEERVRSRTSQLEVAMRELETFSYSVSHDLRAPLRHISSFADMAFGEFRDSGNEEGLRQLGVIRQAALRLGKLVDQLLAFSRIGRTGLNLVPVDLRSLVDEIGLELESEFSGRSIQWVVDELPVVNADPVLLRQALSNLISNAVKFTRRNPRARIEVASYDGDRRTVIVVRDNGVGFDPEYSEKLFGVFQRLHANEEFEGSGIGLANVKRIAEYHGGTVWAKAKEGEGAEFHLSLPSGKVNSVYEQRPEVSASYD